MNGRVLSLLVELCEKNLHLIIEELKRWRLIIGNQYRQKTLYLKAVQSATKHSGYNTSGRS